MMKKYLLTILILTILASGLVVSGCQILKPVQNDNIGAKTDTNVVPDPSAVIPDSSPVIPDPSSVIPAEAGIQGQNTDTSTTTEEIDTSGWKTYRNEEYGFEFKYPGDWILGETNEGVIIKYSKEWQIGMKQGFSPFSVVITQQNLEDFIESYKDDFSDGVPLTRIISQQGYVLDNKAGTRLVGNNAMGINSFYIFIVYDRKNYLISFNENEEVQKIILSTLQLFK